MAGVCLLIGLPVGYLLRGSAPEPTAVAATAPVAAMPAAPASPEGAAPTTTSGDMPHKMPSMEDMKHMADTKAEPLLSQLKSDPNNAQLLNKVGIIYRARTSSIQRKSISGSRWRSIRRTLTCAPTWQLACSTAAMLTAL